VLQDLNSLITKFDDDEYPDLWFTDARHQDLEVINEKVFKSPADQARSSGIKKRIQNKKFSPKEKATLLLCSKCSFITSYSSQYPA